MDKRRLSIIAATRALAPRPLPSAFDDNDLLRRLSRLRAQTDNAEVADLIGEAIAAVAGMSWRPIATAPCDEAIIICTDAGTVGEGFQHSDDGSFLVERLRPA